MISLSNEKALVKTAYYLFFPCIVLTILEFVLLLPAFSFDNFTSSPLSLKNTVLASLYLYIVSISSIYIYPQMDKCNLTKGYILSMFTLFLTSVFIIGTLGTLEGSLYRYPEYIILKRINFLNFFTNVENIFFFSILSDLIITLGMCLCSFKEKKEKIFFTFLSFIITYIIYLKTSFLSIIYSYMHIVLLILFVLNIIKGKIKN